MDKTWPNQTRTNGIKNSKNHGNFPFTEYFHLVSVNINSRWIPPEWSVGIVWIVLFLLSSIGSFLVWLEYANRKAEITVAALLYIVTLMLIGLWSPLFFGRHNLVLALVDLCFLFIAALVTTILFFRISKFAGVLMLPYTVWLVLPIAINTYIVMYNQPKGENSEELQNTTTTEQVSP